MTYYVPDNDIDESEKGNFDNIKNSSPSKNIGMLTNILLGASDLAENATKSALAGTAGAIKGVGKTGEDLTNNLSKFTEGLGIYDPGNNINNNPGNKNKSIFDYSHPKNPLTKFLYNLEQENPISSEIGQAGGEILGTSAIPGVGAAGKVAESIIGNKLGTGLISKASKIAANSGTQGALLNALTNNSDQSLTDKLKEGGSGSAILGLALNPASKVVSGAFNAVKRFKDVRNANIADLEKMSNNLYSKAITEPHDAGVKIQPLEFGKTLNKYLDNFTSGNPNVRNKEYLPTLFEHLDGVTSSNPMSDTPLNVHQVIQRLNDQALSSMPGNYNRFGLPQNRQAAKMFSDLSDAYKEDLKRDLTRNGFKDSADSFDKANNFYKNIFIPIRDSQVNKDELLKQKLKDIVNNPIHGVGKSAVNGLMGLVSPSQQNIERFFSSYEKPSFSNEFGTKHSINGYQNMANRIKNSGNNTNRLAAILSTLGIGSRNDNN